MRTIIILFLTLATYQITSAQYVYTIKADSVKLTNCDSTELIIENHTQAVPGFLFNTGNGRTIFKRALTKINNNLYLVGADSLPVPGNAWVQGGNSFGATGVLGTLDNNHLDFYTNSVQQGRLTNTGNLLLGSTTDNGVKLQVVGTAYLKAGDGTLFGSITAADNNGRAAVFGERALSPVDYDHRGLQIDIFPDRATIHSFSNVRTVAPANLSLNENGGNVLIGTITDNGATLQTNGSITATQQVQAGNFVPGAPVSTSGAGFITQGSIRATGGFNLRDPAAGDNTMLGLFSTGGASVSLYSNNYAVLTGTAVGSNPSGSVIAIGSGFNPAAGSGIVNVLDLSTSGINMLSGSNSITYNYINLSPDINQTPYGTGITRGVFINPNLSAAADWRSIETVKGDNRLNTTSGNTGIGLNSAPLSKLDLQGDTGYSQFRMRTSYTPSSSTDANGNVGDFSWDGNYFYIKTPAGWKRSALTTF
jgi:hypothetical protein